MNQEIKKQLRMLAVEVAEEAMEKAETEEEFWANMEAGCRSMLNEFDGKGE